MHRGVPGGARRRGRCSCRRRGRRCGSSRAARTADDARRAGGAVAGVLRPADPRPRALPVPARGRRRDPRGRLAAAGGVAYLLSAAATFANMYVVLTTYYPRQPEHHATGSGSATASPRRGASRSPRSTQARRSSAWTFFQLRDGGRRGHRRELAIAGHGMSRTRTTTAGSSTGRPTTAWPPRAGPTPRPRGAARPRLGVRLPGPALGAAAAASGVGAVAAATARARRRRRPGPAGLGPATRDARALGPCAWFRARLGDSPVRADRSRALERRARRAPRPARRVDARRSWPSAC